MIRISQKLTLDDKASVPRLWVGSEVEPSADLAMVDVPAVGDGDGLDCRLSEDREVVDTRMLVLESELENSCFSSCQCSSSFVSLKSKNGAEIIFKNNVHSSETLMWDQEIILLLGGPERV